MFHTTSCRGHKITVICGFTIVSHVQEFFAVEIYHVTGTEHTTKLQGVFLIHKHREIPYQVNKAENIHSPFFCLAFRRDKPEASVSKPFGSAELCCNRTKHFSR